MNENDIDVNECERRLDAYIDMLMKVYHVDGYGLADLIGMSHTWWTRNMNAPWDEKRITFFFGLANLTGISLSWLIAEK